MGRAAVRSFPGLKVIMKILQKNIIDIVNLYVSENNAEYEAFARAMKQKQALQTDKYAEIKGSDMVHRAMYEVPETLDSMFKFRLEDESHKYLITKEGSRWFAKNFPTFRLGKKV